MFDVLPVVHTSNISSRQKKNFFRFPVTVKNSIKVGPLVFLLQMFVITENIMKRPVCLSVRLLACTGAAPTGGIPVEFYTANTSGNLKVV